MKFASRLLFLAALVGTSLLATVPAAPPPAKIVVPIGDSSTHAGQWENQPMLAPANLVAWCMVPFDSRNRTPAERIAMLQRLGFTQYAWDWRQKHLTDLSEEIRLAREAGVRLRAVWLWIDQNSDQPGQLSAANRTVIDTVIAARLSVEYWVGIHANFFEGLDEPAKVRKGAALIATIRDRAKLSGSTINLYNHGDWFGETAFQIKVIEALNDPTLGLVYNFHHAHPQIARFPELLSQMLPYLRVVNLNGMRPEGPKILPLGTGTKERGMIKVLQDSGYQGAIGIIGHTEGEDVELVLRRNLDGLREIQAGR